MEGQGAAVSLLWLQTIDRPHRSRLIEHGERRARRQRPTTRELHDSRSLRLSPLFDLQHLRFSLSSLALLTSDATGILDSGLGSGSSRRTSFSHATICPVYFNTQSCLQTPLVSALSRRVHLLLTQTARFEPLCSLQLAQMDSRMSTIQVLKSVRCKLLQSKQALLRMMPPLKLAPRSKPPFHRLCSLHLRRVPRRGIMRPIESPRLRLHQAHHRRQRFWARRACRDRLGSTPCSRLLRRSWVKPLLGSS